MKRLLQIAAVLVIGLMAAQPVLSSLDCAARMASSCAPGCPMAMSVMAPDCAMTGMSATQDCTQNCCSRNSVEAMLLQVSTGKARTASSIPAAILATTTSAPVVAIPAEAALDVRSSSPPRYIVNRVFRI
ncbi:MAG TPA: hypothetical protein VL986_04990 [Terracidiphilus sp.]|nr:hypothetical protein [Terracidiphilus sp.]